LSNPKYSNLFYYIGAFVNERHKLIEDGAPDEMNEDDSDLSAAQQKIRAE